MSSGTIAVYDTRSTCFILASSYDEPYNRGRAGESPINLTNMPWQPELYGVEFTGCGETGVKIDTERRY